MINCVEIFLKKEETGISKKKYLNNFSTFLLKFQRNFLDWKKIIQFLKCQTFLWTPLVASEKNFLKKT